LAEPSTVGESRASVAVVIITHNRYQKLDALLASLSAHPTVVLRSVVVVDDSERKEELRKLPGISLDHVGIDGRVFITHAKNLGWRRTNEEFVYFIDDDNILHADWAEPMVRIMAGNPSIGALDPAVLYKSRPDLVWVYATPFAPGKWGHTLVGRNLPRNPSLEGQLLETDALANASLIRRSALERVGGFDERLVINSSADLCARLKAAGWNAYAFTGTFLYHDVRPPGEIGWWAAHGAVDPQRVRYEIADWFRLMKRLHPSVRLFRLRATIRSLRFILPNLGAYMLTGRERRLPLAKSVLRGFVEGVAGR
jgi:GT2 family glycosyltransferase